MFYYHTAYRYIDGRVEGFVGFSLVSEEKAKQKAIAKIIEKIGFIRNEPDFNESCMITKHSQCNQSEQAIISLDWNISKQSKIT